jgi:hypothetical protein
MSDILTASGNKIDTAILLLPPSWEKYSTMQWPVEQPTPLDMQLWKTGMLSICPSQCKTSSIGCFVITTHRIWRWTWCKDDSTLQCSNNNRETEGVYVTGRKPNCFHFSHNKRRGTHGVVCSVTPTFEAEHWRLLSSAPCTIPAAMPSTFLEVLETWGNTWMWEHMTVMGGVTWVSKSIRHGTLVTVMDGFFI